jgi:hypothetical protein
MNATAIGEILLSQLRKLPSGRSSVGEPPGPPRTEAELASWISTEKRDRKRIDGIFRVWLRDRQWPVGLSVSDATYAAIRIRCVFRWLAVAAHFRGHILSVDPNVALRALLVRTWPTHLEYFEMELASMVEWYRCGKTDDDSFSFSL